MILNEETAQKTAELLLQINAIKLSPEEPFVWASGWHSPIYCDNRVILSYPQIRNFVKSHLVKGIEDLYGKPDVIAGVATGAIGMGALVAQEMNLPFVYVRPEPKKHGRQNQIEGHLDKNQRVVVIEDLISTGKSSLNAVKALRAADVDVKGMLAVFSYGFKVAEDNFKQADLALNTLSNYHSLLKKALESHYINDSQLEVLSTWNANPSEWTNQQSNK
jgi:orotate phosphoribosyltransferase